MCSRILRLEILSSPQSGHSYVWSFAQALVYQQAESFTLADVTGGLLPFFFLAVSCQICLVITYRLLSKEKQSKVLK